MNEPILKIHWERFKAHIDLDIAKAQALIGSYTRESIEALVLLSEGCANTNYKIVFKSNISPVVLRIYVREKTALQREINIHRLAENNQLPIARHLYADSSCLNFEYPYAVMEWVEGQLLREIILKKDEKSISECMFQAGQYLSRLRQIHFSQGGFFESDFKVRPFNPDEEYLSFIQEMLNDPIVQNSLKPELHSALLKLILSNTALLPPKDPANLTHGDYDPANMLVRKTGDRFEIAAILDWEFAFAGSYLLDIGMMIRYSHKLPLYYEQKFVEGIEMHGILLPDEWKKRVKLMDLLCLLQLIHNNPLEKRPNLNQDVVSLITHTVENWDTF